MSEAHSEQLAAAGWALLRAGNARGAVRHFTDALAADAENTDAMAGLAQSHLNLDELKPAEDTVAALLRAAPNDATAHRLRAESLRRRRQPYAAAKIAREAIGLRPFEERGYHILALCHSDQKDNRSAVKVCDEGLAIAPGSPILHAQRADNLLELRGGKAAEPDIEIALGLAPNSEYVQRVAARVAVARNQLDRARDLLSIVLRRDANNREALSLYLMTEPRHRILRSLYIFRYWRKEKGALGWAVFLGLWGVVILAALPIVFVTNVPGLFIGLGVRFFLQSQYNAHRKEVQAHFAKFALSGGF